MIGCESIGDSIENSGENSMKRALGATRIAAFLNKRRDFEKKGKKRKNGQHGGASCLPLEIQRASNPRVLRVN